MKTGKKLKKRPRKGPRRTRKRDKKRKKKKPYTHSTNHGKGPRGRRKKKWINLRIIPLEILDDL